MSIPKGTTHVWTPAVDHPTDPTWWVRRLPYFKKVKGIWWVYSNASGWRMTGNQPEWFAEEKKQGYFVTITKFNSPTFVSKKEVW